MVSKKKESIILCQFCVMVGYKICALGSLIVIITQYHHVKLWSKEQIFYSSITLVIDSYNGHTV